MPINIDSKITLNIKRSNENMPEMILMINLIMGSARTIIPKVSMQYFNPLTSPNEIKKGNKIRREIIRIISVTKIPLKLSNTQKAESSLPDKYR